MGKQIFKIDEPMRSELIDAFAQRIAKHRCNGQVYMNGLHNPKPTEKYLAEDLLLMLEFKVNEAQNG